MEEFREGIVIRLSHMKELFVDKIKYFFLADDRQCLEQTCKRGMIDDVRLKGYSLMLSNKKTLLDPNLNKLLNITSKVQPLIDYLVFLSIHAVNQMV